MSYCRIDPIRIKTPDYTPRQKGGQGVVSVGSLSLRPSEEVKQLVFKLKGIAEEVQPSAEELSEFLRIVTEELEIWPPEIHVMAEMIEMSREALDEWQHSMNVAVKVLEWNRNDAEESTKFFKVCSPVTTFSRAVQSKSSL